ncbi:Abi family protein [Streptococcus suis]|uniref:Abi family protein n=1 Tax=Streptococcus suis TaxID=1307 RepID=UPI0009429185|nr:Abi family protein [Streptococcus suis]HEL1594626.1 Abi family protein [Streptococcus suis]HEL2249200.1 Abi family protein [Streptococcus suis]HEL2424273.1 Abi family protein [Streptococcus suis]
MNRIDKKSYRDLVNQLEQHGVKFELISKGKAITFLEKNNYYYKVAAFRKNFKKKNGRYQNLDFQHLVDLATIDMYVRDTLLDIAINVEHFIKVELSRLITNNTNEDGYSIVQDFAITYPSYYQSTYERFRKSRYQKDMFLKRGSIIPIWVLMEHMDFGCLLKLVELYYLKYKPKSLQKVKALGNNARHIRNACAHNSVLMVNVFKDDEKLKRVTAEINTFAKQKNVLRYRKYRKVNDLLSLVALSNTYCSPAVQHHQNLKIQDLLDRMQRYSADYTKTPELVKMFIIFGKIVDNTTNIL